MDLCLRYKDHKAKIGTKELKAAIALKRMRSLTLLIVRQLFHATVALVTNYVLIIWAHTLEPSADKIFRRIQKLGALAITGAFNSVARGVLEAEAYIWSINT